MSDTTRRITGFAINVARDLGPRIAHAILPVPDKGGSDWGDALIPVIGGLTGGVVCENGRNLNAD
jgi:glycerol uptake facilitator protein